MPGNDARLPSPRRVAAGRANRLLRGPLSPEGRERLLEAILRVRPWEFATGPRTPEGKARAALNGKVRQSGALSVRELRASVADVGGLVAAIREAQERLNAV